MLTIDWMEETFEKEELLTSEISKIKHASRLLEKWRQENNPQETKKT